MRLRALDLDVDPWKELLKKLKRVAICANKKGGIDSPSVFERLARETFAGMFEQMEGDREE